MNSQMLKHLVDECKEWSLYSLLRLLQKSGQLLMIPYDSLTLEETIHSYDGFTYKLMAHDYVRNRAYQRAFAALRGKNVVEIGPGSHAVLSKLALQAGAKKLYAIEANPDAIEACQAFAASEPRFHLLPGISTEVEVPELCDVLFHELVGSIGSNEGMARIAKDAKARFLRPDAICIPSSCSTFFSPIAPLEPLLSAPNKMLHRFFSGSFRTEQAHSSGSLCYVYNCPQDAHLTTTPKCFEHIDFNADFALQFSNQVTFSIEKEGEFGGFLFWIHLELSAGNAVNSLRDDLHWPTVYARVCDPPTPLRVGDQLVVDIHVDLSTELPFYRLETRLERDGVCVTRFDSLEMAHR